MVLPTRVLFCVAGLVVFSQSIPLGDVRQSSDVDVLHDLDSEGSDNPLQDLIKDAMKQIEGNVLRQFVTQSDQFFPDQGLTGSQTVFSGTNTAFNGAQPVFLPTQTVLTPVAVPQGNNNAFGNALVGSIIGSSVATLLPLLLRRAATARIALLTRDGLNDDELYYNELVNPSGSKGAHLYPNYTLQLAEDAKEDIVARKSPFGFRVSPYHRTKVGTINIKAPSDDLEIDDSLSRKLKEYFDNKAY